MKHIFVDWGYLMFTAIFCSIKDSSTPATYRALAMMIAYLKMVDIEPEDTVVIAVDSSVGSWRKEVDPAYKANRKARRLKYDINWDKEFKRFKQVLDNLESTTPFHVIEIDRLEADDIISYGVRKFTETPCIIISSDSDYEQLYAFKNVRVFSPRSKSYKKVKDPYKVLSQKIIREKSDNLTSKLVSEEDYARREKIVSLLKLPDEIETQIEERINFLPPKGWSMEDFFHPTLVNRLENLYEKDRVVDVNYVKPKPPKPVKQMYLFSKEE